MKKMSYAVFLTVFLFVFTQSLFAQVEKGVTSTGKEVDCSTIDPSVDKTVNEHGKVVTSPRVTRNGKLITEECGVVTVSGKEAGGFCIGGDTTIIYEVSTSIAGTYTYKWYVNEVLQSSDSTKLIFTFNAADTYTIRCEVASGIGTSVGTDEITTLITSYTLPTISITGDLIICSGENGTLTATSGLSNYVWSSNVVSATGNSATINAAGTYSVTATGDYGCINSTSATVTLIDPAVTSAVTISGDNSVCYDEGTTLTASATASTGATLTYQWYKNGIAISGATSNTLNTGNLTDASTTFKCEVKAVIGDCVSAASEASKVIIVNHPIAGTVSVSADATTLCNGGNTTVRANVTGNTGTLSYQWYLGSSAISGATSNTYNITNIAATGTYKCEVTATVNGCTATADNDVTIAVPTPTPGTISITTDPIIICYNSSAEIIATATGNVGSLSYQWYNNDALISGATSSTYTTGNLTATSTFKCVITATQNGCTSSATTVSKEVVVNDPQVTSAVTISGDNSVCYDEGTTLTASATASTGATLTYQWYKNGTAITGATSSTLNTGNLTDASTTFKCEVEAEIDGCVSAVSEASKVITVNHPIAGTVSVSADATTLCSGGNTTVRASVTGNTGTLSYQWYLGSSAISGATSNTYNVTNISASGTYKCEVTATVNGCTATATNSVTVTVPTPTPGTISITTDPIIICYNSSAEIIATATGNVGTLSYQWYLNDALIPGATSSTYTTGNLTATSTFKCVITATQDGCTSSSTTASKEVIVNNPSVTSTVSITGDANVCAGSTTTLTASATASSGATLTYQWYKNSSIISGATAQSYTTEAINAATTYKCVVTAKIGDCTSAPKEASTTVNIIPITLSDVTITPATANICSGATAQFTASATGSGTVTYQWKQASTEVATTAAFTTPALTENTTYTCYATSTYNGCTLTKSANASVVVVKPTVGTLSVEGGTICYNTSKTLQAQATGNNGSLSYQWSTGGSDISGAISASYTTPTLTATTVYTVNVTATITSPITCSVTDSKDVTVTVSQPVFDTLEICACKLPHTFHYSGGTLTFTNAEMDLHSPRIDTLTKTYPIGSCPDAGHFTVVLWDPDNVVSSTSCSGIAFPNHTTSTNEVVSGDTLNAVEYNGYSYKVVQIGEQCWLKENLRTKLKPDGATPINPVTSNSNATNTYYSFSGNISFQSGCQIETIDFAEYENRFGLMYNWFTAMDSDNPAYGLTDHQGICPDGWHIPDTTEFQTMANYVGIVGEWSNPTYGVGDQISTGQHAVRLATGCEWKSSTVPTSPGDYAASDRNSSGFSARPSGCWNNAPAPGSWYALGDWAFFWSSTRQETPLSNAAAAYNFDLHPDWAGLSRDKNGNDQSIGRSVRCVRDEEDALIYTSEVIPADNTATCSYTTLVSGTSGVCWNTTGNPTTDDAHTAATTAAGSFSANLTGLSAHTLYYVRSYVIVDDVPIYGNELTFRVHSEPVVVTADSSAGQTTATLRGNLTDAGGYDNTVRGIYWGTTDNPTTPVAATGTGEGVYSVYIDGLTGGTTYYYRAYATNEKGTVLGDVKSFTTPNCEGNVNYYGVDYPIKLIGSQCWMTKNLRTTKTRSGSDITKGRVANNLATSEFSSSALYYNPYEDIQHTTEYTIYGYLYNHTAAELICPEGWHLPTEADWQTLNAYAIANYGCNGYSAQALASNGNWRDYSVTGGPCVPGYAGNANNDGTHFTLRPAGYVDRSGYLFTDVKQVQANVWSSTPDGANYKYVRIHYNYPDLWFGSGDIKNGYSVRCVRDN